MRASSNEYKRINNLPKNYIPVMLVTYFSINVLSLALPLTMKKIYSSIIVSRSIEALRFMLLFALLAMLLETLMRQVRETSSKWIASKYEYALSDFLIRKLLSIYKYDDSSNNFISNMEKFKSVSRLASFNSTAYYQLYIDVPFMAVFLYLIYLYGGSLVYIPIALSIVYVIFIAVISNMYFKTQSSFVYYNDRVMSQLIETLEKVHQIKGSGIEESQIIKYKKLLDDVTHAEYESNKYKILPKIMATKFSQLTLFMTLIAGGYLLTQNAITFGQITACAMLSGRAISPIVSLMRYYQQTKDIKILKDRIDKIAFAKDQYSEDIPDFPDDIYGVIEVHNLEYEDIKSKSKEYFSLSVSAGDMITINPIEFPSYRIIFNKIMGVEPIDGGRILIDNLDIREWNMHSLKGKIEYLNDKVSIFKGSVIENITYFKASEIQNAYEAASLTGLDELVSMMPEGFETELDSHMLNYLTAAFLQRLNLSRALLERPRIIIFDRIDESMDRDTLELFLWLIEKFKGKSTIIVASGNKDILGMADYQVNVNEVVNHKVV